MKKTTLIFMVVMIVLIIIFAILLLVLPNPEASAPAPTAVTTQATEASTEATEPPKPPANTYISTDFAYDENGFLTCVTDEYLIGVDLSEFQENVDFNAMREAGIDFLMMRLGFRSYGAGRLVVDEYARNYIKEAHEAGMQVGGYFFSQAVTVEEAIEEAEFALEIIKGLPLELPIAFDWEYIGDYARTAETDKETVTACTKAFCDRITEAGYKPMFYSNQVMSDSHFDLVDLQDHPMWLAMYDQPMTYPHRMVMWQYTSAGTVPGYDGAVDMDIYLPNAW